MKAKKETCLFKNSSCTGEEPDCKCEILKHFETEQERKEKVAWSQVLFTIGLDDLLILWYNLPPNHILFQEPLVKVFRSRIDELGGFKGVSK